MKCPECGWSMEPVSVGITKFGEPINVWGCEYCGKRASSRYIKKALELGRLVETKQEQYGDSWGKAGRILEILYPDGVRPDQYHTFLGITRVIDKLCRLANGNQGEENAWEDLAGYGLLGAVGGERGVSSDLPEVRKGSGDGDEGGEV